MTWPARASASLVEDDGDAAWRACIQLALAPGIGSLSFCRLVERFGSPGEVLGQPASELGRYARSVAKASRVEIEPVWRRETICWTDPDYPPLLRAIADPPPVLWFLGRRPDPDRPRIAVVGTRKATAYGRRIAADLARTLSAADVEVVSGLALGIDGAAHRGALDGQAGTIAVLGSGIRHIFPTLHRELANRILGNGTILSEFLPSSPARAGHFPRRNRIISGLCDATIVVEAKSKGGALITARLALDQGRSVYAVPGDLGRPSSEGTNSLIRQKGAELLLNADKLIRDQWPALALGGETLFTTADGHKGHEKLLECLASEPRGLESICNAMGQNVSDILVELLELEMNGLVRQYAGKQFGLTG